MGYVIIEPNIQHSLSFMATQLRDTLGTAHCERIQRSTYAALSSALLRFGSLPILAGDRELIERTLCATPNIELVDNRLCIKDPDSAENFIADSDCASDAYRRAWNTVTEFIQSSCPKMEDAQFVDMLVYAVSSGMNLLRYVLPRTGTTTLCDNLLSLFPMRHFAVYSPHGDAGNRWTLHSNDANLTVLLRGLFRRINLPNMTRSSRQCLVSALRELECVREGMHDSLVVVFDASQAEAADAEKFAQLFIGLNLQVLMFVSPSRHDVQMAKLLTPRGNQSWLVNAD